MTFYDEKCCNVSDEAVSRCKGWSTRTPSRARGFNYAPTAHARTHSEKEDDSRVSVKVVAAIVCYSEVYTSVRSRGSPPWGRRSLAAHTPGD